MPIQDDLRLPLDPELETQLERVRVKEGLDSLDQAYEFLIRRRLRKGIAALTGRGRALYPIKGERQ
ncbi:hypothetical protein R5R73_01230 [Salinicola sp. LHM]|uniref:hypothetical protein n=1 Tax=Salinicola sp. LHM TaxID=3065298 RepID=UPI002ACEB9CC|nr:hypothetical protein [Salinicola sp. LHM]WQH33349.1 hypothetical protein R5R73_01230 [Salinicola sp. LHM]